MKKTKLIGYSYAILAACLLIWIKFTGAQACLERAYHPPMLSKLLSALPTIFSLNYSGRYERIVAQATADQLMGSAWLRVGQDLEQAIEKVGRDVEEQDHDLVSRRKFGFYHSSTAK